MCLGYTTTATTPVAGLIKPTTPVTFKKGDKVRILRKVADYDQGWKNVWVREMDQAIGKVGTVQYAASGCNDVTVEVPGIDLFGYPEFVLELVKGTPAPAQITPAFKVGDKVRVDYPQATMWNGEGVIKEIRSDNPDLFIIKFNRTGHRDQGGFDLQHLTLLPTEQYAVLTKTSAPLPLRSGRVLDVARQIAVRAAKNSSSRTVNADIVQAELLKVGFTSADLGNAAGQVFKIGFINTSNTVKSTRPGNNSRRIIVWKYIGA